jgi:sec-independent protein translocase protein TatB
VFGLSFGEITLLLIVGIVVVGPKNLPSMMRTVGQWIAKLRRMSTDLRAQSGIDELIRLEGLEREIAELRSFTRMNVVDSLITPAISPSLTHAVAAAPPRPVPRMPEVTRDAPLREREYPLLGCDAEGALPDDAVIYAPPPQPITPEPRPEPQHVPVPAPAPEAAPALADDALVVSQVAVTRDTGSSRAQPEPLHAEERREGSAL